MYFTISCKIKLNDFQVCPDDVPALWAGDAHVFASLDGFRRRWCFWSASCKSEDGYLPKSL